MTNTQQTIKLHFTTLEGINKTKAFKTLAGARKAAQDWLGVGAQIGAGYAISTDGVVKVSANGCSLNNLFGTLKAQVEAPVGFTAKRKSADSYELYCGKVCPMNLFALAFEAYDVRVGDARDGWALKGLAFEFDRCIDPDAHYATLQGALTEAKSAFQAFQEYQGEVARAEQHAEGAWLRHAEMGSVESQHDEDMERMREAAMS